MHWEGPAEASIAEGATPPNVETPAGEKTGKPWIAMVTEKAVLSGMDEYASPRRLDAAAPEKLHRLGEECVH
jgi:hypothetical protein